jgi:hypothetical protein
MDQELFSQDLYEAGEPTGAALNNRIAASASGLPIKNMTWSGLITWLNSVLSFMKPSQNLNDLTNKATSRTNLSVYSKTESDGRYPSQTNFNTEVAKWNNWKIFAAGEIGWDGTVYIYNVLITVQKDGTGIYRIIHNANASILFFITPIRNDHNPSARIMMDYAKRLDANTLIVGFFNAQNGDIVDTSFNIIIMS